MTANSKHKPVWRSKWVWLVGLLLLIGYCNRPDDGSTSIATNEAEGMETAPAKSSEEIEAEERAIYMERLDRELDGIAEFNVSEYTSDASSITIGTALFSLWAQLAEDGSSINLDAQQEEILAEFKREVSAVQRNAFPVLRDAYGPIARQTLWEHDIHVKTFGTGFRTIQFVGGTFAANRNIKDFQTELRDLLHRLRFKQSRYKWYDGASEYTYYDMDSHDDGALVVWVENGRFRVVE